MYFCRTWFESAQEKIGGSGGLSCNVDTKGLSRSVHLCWTCWVARSRCREVKKSSINMCVHVTPKYASSVWCKSRRCQQDTCASSSYCQLPRHTVLRTAITIYEVVIELNELLRTCLVRNTRGRTSLLIYNNSCERSGSGMTRK
jgi:hypothetical protein